MTVQDDQKLTQQGLLLRKSVLEISRLRDELQKAKQASAEPIAVLGMSCRTPGGPVDPAAYWKLLDEGGDAITALPERWHADDLYDPDPDAAGKTTSRAGGFLPDVERFDAAFFGISAREALSMDPQQRLVLEVAWEALERAGVKPDGLHESRTGVYIGAVGCDYAPFAALDGHFATGRAVSVVSGRVSYVLGLTGPALTVDTACSSSLVAVHLACAGLRHGECDLALAGGVQVLSTPAMYIEFSRLRGLAADGRCKAFAANADGVGWGEGCGVLVLKRLADAQRDEDPVLAVLLGSAVNQDGRSQGLTAPNGPSQQRVIRKALEVSGLTPNDIDAIEAHGTGTPLGDPIEAGALAAVFGPARGAAEPVHVGSSKSNLGHTSGAAGILGLMKMVLALVHERLPRTLHAELPTQEIAWEADGLSLLQQAQPWPRRAERPRRAGVSSFGFSGTNAHLIVQEAPLPVAASVPSEAPVLGLPLLVSARDEAALREQAQRWADWLEAHPETPSTQLVQAAASRRTHFARRAAIMVEARGTAREQDQARESVREPNIASTAEVIRALRALSARKSHYAVREGKALDGSLAVLFSGQGSQRLGMGRELFGQPGFEVYTEALEEVLRACDPHLPVPLRAVMWGDGAHDLAQTRYTQPALFALEVALYRQWQHWGVRPQLLVGHSVGEIVCAHLAGVLSLADAAALVCARGRLMEELATAGGAMASVELSEAELSALLAARAGEGSVEIAALNTPQQTVISGDEAAVDALLQELSAKGCRTTLLSVSHAFHSAHMDGMLEAFRGLAESLSYGAPTLAVVSNLTGQLADVARGDLVTADYWVRQVRGAVRFADCMQAASAAGARVFLECGPQAVLCAMAQACLQVDAREQNQEREVACVASLRKRVEARGAAREQNEDELASMMRALADLHLHGQRIDWDKLVRRGAPLDLPTYAFQRQRYWLDAHGAHSELLASNGSTEDRGQPDGSTAAALRERLMQLPETDRLVALITSVQEVVAVVLRLADSAQVAAKQPLQELGLDSLMALEVRNRLSVLAEVTLPATLLFDYPTPEAIAKLLLGRAFNELGAVTQAPVVRRVRMDEPIAVLALACRVPGGVFEPEAYWQLLDEGRDAVGPFPARWDLDAIYDADPDAAGKTYVREGGFLTDVDHFDAGMFGISPREATSMDPQQRLTLEVAWEALERAGIQPAALEETNTGVYLGSTGSDYGVASDLESFDGQSITGLASSVLSGRVSYVLGLQGPALTVDTACSSSLVALHLACAGLRQGECDLALAGGVQVMSTPAGFVEFSRLRGMASDGRCKSFSADADGVGWAEGCGILVLKRATDARRDGDRVLALLRGSAINQDGRSQGLTAPNGPSQQRVIRSALAACGLRPSDLDAVEAHGTGTTLGDPIEAGALAAVFGPSRAALEQSIEPLWLGSSKSNFGHAQAAAGVLGVMKMVLALMHERLPRTLHAAQPSPHVSWEGAGLALLHEARPWPRNEQRVRRAGVSSFGMSGTNAHVIVEEAPTREPSRASEFVAPSVSGSRADARASMPLLVSGRDEAALRAQAERWASWLEANVDVAWADVARTAALHRTHFEHRAALLVSDASQAAQALRALAQGAAHAAVIEGRAQSGKLTVLFTGQGSQRLGMGRELYGQPGFAAFTQALDEVIEACAPHLPRSLKDVLWADESSSDASLLAQTRYTQPALFALEVALYRQWQAWGARPQLLLGHSVGELACAHVAEVLSLADAAALVCARGRLMEELATPSGAMASVQASAQELEALLAGDFEALAGQVAIAGLNTPNQTVVSGDRAAVRELVEKLREQGRKVTELTVSHAFHSAHMDGMLAAFRELADGLHYQSPKLAVISNVSGRLADPAQGELVTADYWVRHVREAVRFSEGVESLLEAGARVLLECGPQGVLCALAAECLASDSGSREAALVASLRKGLTESEALLAARAALHVHGQPLSWPSQAALHSRAGEAPAASTGAERADLPTYAFQRRPYWLEASSSRLDVTAAGLRAAQHPLLGAATSIANGEGVLFTGRLSLKEQPWLADHRMFEQVLFPGTGMVELALAAGHVVDARSLSDLTLATPLVLPSAGALRVQVFVAPPDAEGRRAVTLHSRHDATEEHAPWTLHASGVLAAEARAADARDRLEQWPPAGAVALDVTDLYPTLASQQFGYGPAFQGLRAAFRAGDTLYGEVALGAEQAQVAGDYGVHPALFDAALHLLGVGQREQSQGGLLLPFAWSDVTLHAKGARVLRVRARLAAAEREQASAVISLFDEAGQAVLHAGGLQLRRATAEQLRSAVEAEARDLYEVVFQPVMLADQAPLGEARGSAHAPSSESLVVLGGRGVLSERLGAAQVPDVSALQALLDAGDAVPTRIVIDATTWRRADAEARGSVHEQDVEARDSARERRSEARRSAREQNRDPVVDLPGAAVERTQSALLALQALLAEPRLANAALVWVTAGALSGGPDDGVQDLSHAPLWGLLRSVRPEFTDRVIRALDLDRSELPAERLRQLLATDAEDELLWRYGKAVAPRLIALGSAADGTLSAPVDAAAWRLDLPARGSLSQLQVVPAPEALSPLASGQLRIAVRASGVNFRDALHALGMVEAPWLGLEVAGEVIEVGEGVQRVRVGDRVMGLARATFATTTIGDARLVTRIPDNLSYAEAATIPLVFLTALYGLRELAALAAGERVLIHAAAGGVGMAAVQIARRMGAQVFGTASRPKWETLGELGVPASQLANSRDTRFEGHFLELTAGQGVDVVLNALAGEFVDASLRLLPRGGRFLEMGKTDVRDAEAVRAAHPGVRYQAFDLMDASYDRLASLLDELALGFARGELRPLPFRAYPLRQAPAAYRYIASGRHVGKLILQAPRRLDPAGTVLITGGVGELGQALARHLVAEHGVRHLVLTSRQGPDAPAARALVPSLEALGVESVAVCACDVGERAEIEDVLATIDPSRPLTAVFHLAGVLSDVGIAGLTPERLAHVMRPKVAGAWHLHALTTGLDLAAFVLFSSSAAVFGTPGQANYSAANLFLSALAAERQKSGLAGQALAWGLWAPQGSGLTGHLGEVELSRMRRQGFAPLPYARGMELFDASLRHPSASLVPMLLDLRKVRLELEKAGRAHSGPGGIPSLLRGLVRPSLRSVEAGNLAGTALRKRLGGLPASERLAAVLSFVQETVAAVVGLAGPLAVPASAALKDLGVDSLLAMEIRNQLSARIESPLPATLVFDYPTPEAVAKLLLSQAFADVGEVVQSEPVRHAQRDEPIAVLAMACRAPGGVSDPEGYWRLLDEGRDAVGPFPARWDVEALFDPDPEAEGKSYVREGGFIADVDQFDASFFGISPREAVAMDPQQRLVLEVSWEALERAGRRPDTLNESSTGVYLGSLGADYGLDVTVDAAQLDGHLGTGRASSVLSGRVAYVLGLTGPAMTVDTACSSSLVALHLACAGLRLGECDLALAGGVQVMSTPGMFVESSRLRAMAPDGRCKAFSAQADGAGWAEGCGILVLKRLSDALREGDRVLAVVRGSAVNQDGRSQGLTAPNGPAQQQVIKRALSASGLSPNDIDAVEAHGTGTRLGDPIEAGALSAVFAPGRANVEARGSAGEQDVEARGCAREQNMEPLYLGSSKSNLGHTQAAAGVLGVMKMVLALVHERLPRTLHAAEPSPHLDWERSGLRLLDQARPWPRNALRVRRAGVSSFGMSGTNAHLIVEEAPAAASMCSCADPCTCATREVAPGSTLAATPAVSLAAGATLAAVSDASPGSAASSSARRAKVGVPLLISGRDEGALRAQAQRWARWLEQHVDARGSEREPVEAAGSSPARERRVEAAGSSPARERRVEVAGSSPARERRVDAVAFADVVRTAALLRTPFAVRAAVFAENARQAIEGLHALGEGRPHPQLLIGRASSVGAVVFVFPGQGGQWPAMGRALWEESPVFREAVEACDAALLPHTGWSVAAVLRGEVHGMPPHTRADVVQPANFAMGVALAAVWRSLGVSPAAVVGTSQGEVAAAVVAGALSLEDGARVVALRSQLAVPLAGTGSMAVVQLSAPEVEELLARDGSVLSVAGVNTPGSTIVGGNLGAIESFVARQRKNGVFCRRVVDAEHAAHCREVDGLLGPLAAGLSGLRPQAVQIPMVSTVTGEPVVGSELDASYWCRNLRQPVRLDWALSYLQARAQNVFVELSAHPVLGFPLTTACAGAGAVCGTLSREVPGLEGFYRALGSLHVQGHSVRWQPLLSGRTYVELPTYPFQRQRYWLKEGSARADLSSLGLSETGHPILAARATFSGGAGHLWSGRLSAARPAWASDHKVFDTVLFPGTGFVELALAAGAAAGSPHLRELVVAVPLALSAQSGVRVQLQVEPPNAAGERAFTLASEQQAEGDDVMLAGGTARLDARWEVHATGLLASAVEPPRHVLLAHQPARFDALQTFPPAGAVALELADFYPALAAAGVGYGPAFQGLRKAWRHDATLYGEVSLPAGELERAEGYGLHPALLDAALHLLAAGAETQDSDGSVMLPFAWSDVALHARGARTLRVRMELSELGSHVDPCAPTGSAAQASMRLWAFDEHGQPVLSVGRLEVRRATPAQVRASARSSVRGLYRVRWQPVEIPAPALRESTWVVGGSGALAAALGAEHVSDLDGLFARLDVGEPAPSRLAFDETGLEPEQAAGALSEAAHRVTARALSHVQAVLTEPRLAGTRAVWVTSGAVGAGEQDVEARARAGEHDVEARGSAHDLARAPLWGLLRSARSEHPERVLRAVDLASPGVAPELLARLLVADAESELRWHDGQVSAPRLVTAESEHAARVPASADGQDSLARATTRLEGGVQLDGGTVLITGGVGQLGQALARHLVTAHGVRHLLLSSRRGADSEGARELVSALEELGAESVELCACDVREREQVARMLASVDAGRPLVGVFHLAGALDDGVVTELDGARLAEVLRPKVDGALYLHELTQGTPLAAFVLFSSSAGVMGGPGQANYAAANTFLDALAAERQRQGLAGQSLAWGLWAPQGGGLTRHLGEAELSRMRRNGMAPLSLARGMELLDAALSRPEPLLVPAQLDLGKLQRAYAGELTVPPLLRILVRPSARQVEGGDAAASALRERLGRLPDAERFTTVVALVQDVVAVVMGLSGPAAVPAKQPLSELGLDSLMALGIRNQLTARTQAALPATLVFDYPTPHAIATLILELLEIKRAPSFSHAEVRAKLSKVSIERLLELGVLDTLMAQPDESEALEGAGSSPARERRVEKKTQGVEKHAIAAAEDDALLELAERMLTGSRA